LSEVLGGRLIPSWTDGRHRKRRMKKEMPSSSYKYQAIILMSWVLGGRLIDRYLVGWTTDIERERYRVAKTHRIPYLYRSFSAKVTYI